MKKSKTFGVVGQAVSVWTLTAFILGLVGPSFPRAWAVDTGTGSATNIQTSSLEADYGGCEESCSDVFESMQAVSGKDTKAEGVNKGAFKTSPAKEFGDTEHELCANFCQATNSGAFPNAAHCFETPTFEKKCSLPDQVLLATNTDCTTANKKVKGCKFYKSTLLGQCEVAYRATASNGYQETLLVLDGATAATCGLACWADKTGVGSGTAMACKVAGMAASAAELVGTLVVAFDGASSGHEGRGAGFDVVAGLGGGAGVIAGGTMLGTTGAAAEAAKANAGVAAKKAAKDGASDATKTAATDAQKAADQAEKAEDQKESCISMAIALALGGIRVWSMLEASSTRKEACEQAESLYSQAFQAASDDGGATTTINPNNPLVVSTDGSLTGTTATGSSFSVSEGVGGDTSAPSVSDILSGEGFAATAEGSLLGPSGLGNAIKPLAQQIQASGALKKAVNAGGVGGFVQSALGGLNPTPEQAQAAAAIAKSAFANAPKLAAKIGGGVTYSGGGSKSGGSGSSSNSSNPFGGMFGAAKGGPAATDMAFGTSRGPASGIIPSDIFHKGTDKNIFQIVSDRVRTVEPRLR